VHGSVYIIEENENHNREKSKDKPTKVNKFQEITSACADTCT